MRRVAAAAAAFALTTLSGGATDDTAHSLSAEVTAAQSTITARDLRATVSWLAGDAFQGRATGHPGGDLAGRYIATTLESFDLAAVDDQGILQPLDLVSPGLGPRNSLTIRDTRGQTSVATHHEAGEHLQPVSTSPSGTVDAPLAFAGFGISAPDLGHDDYEGLDAGGRVLLVFDRTPTHGRSPDTFAKAPREHGAIRTKAALATAKGAVALLVVAADGDRHLPDLRKSWPASPSPRERAFELAGDQLPLPVARVSGKLASRLLARTRASERSLDEWRDLLITTPTGQGGSRAAASFELPDRRVSLEVDIRQAPVRVWNALAMIEGRDPALRHELVVVGAHYDHDGLDAEGRVFNGADDNASGTAGVLEIAEAFGRLAEQGLRPRRTVVFAFWNGEERGLLGSRAFAERVRPEGGRVVTTLNLDMIGRDEDVPEGDSRFAGLRPTRAADNANALHVLGYSRSPQLAHLVEAENATIGLELKTALDEGSHNLLRRSDHWPFLQARVPALFFFTGLHPDYHTPQDDPEKLNYPKMERIVRLVYRVAWQVADRQRPPAFVDPERPSER